MAREALEGLGWVLQDDVRGFLIQRCPMISYIDVLLLTVGNVGRRLLDWGTLCHLRVFRRNCWI